MKVAAPDKQKTAASPEWWPKKTAAKSLEIS
jgi:hypothetical protein